MKSVYSAVRTGSLNKAVCASSFKGLKNLQLRNSFVFVLARHLWPFTEL
jgi:hypothetical protein